MQIAPVATAHTQASTTATTPITTPTNAGTTTVEDVAEIDLGGERHGSQTDRAVRWLRTGRFAHQKFLPLVAVVAAAVALAAPVHADPDVDFANELHTYGIYGGKDYNAWIGKITCQRLDNGLDQDAGMSAKFVFRQLGKDATTAQAWQFLGAALRTYCPDKLPVLERAAAQ
jgi:Protein of unknown function (DUF732)